MERKLPIHLRGGGENAACERILQLQCRSDDRQVSPVDLVPKGRFPRPWLGVYQPTCNLTRGRREVTPFIPDASLGGSRCPLGDVKTVVGRGDTHQFGVQPVLARWKAACPYDPIRRGYAGERSCELPFGI